MAARLLLALALVVSIWPFVGGRDAHACTPFRGSPEQAAGLAAELSFPIFIGTVVKSEEPDRDHRVHVFVVERYLLGEGTHQLTIVTRPICPNRYSEGSRYLTGVGATNLDRLSAVEADQRIALMETAILAENGTLGSFTDEPLPPWTTAAGLGAAFAVGAGLLLGVRRLRSG